jgi:hypothetical protein
MSIRYERWSPPASSLQAPPRDAEWGERFFHVTDPTTRDQFCLAAER